MDVSRLNPNQLYRRFEKGEIEFDEVQSKIDEFARELIVEMEIERANPHASFLDRLMNKRAASKLIKEFSEASVRELFCAISEVEDFPPALLLWNADHWDVPLHCFVRLKREPVFRVIALRILTRQATMTIEHGSAKKKETTREKLHFKRDWQERMVLERRETL